MKKILLILCMLFISTAHADVLETCISKIEKNNEMWQDLLFDKTNGIFNFLEEKDELTNDMVQSNKSKIYALIASDILLNCNRDISAISKIPHGIIGFNRNNKEYGFKFSTATMLDYIDMRTGFVVINRKNLKPGDVLELSAIPKKQKFFSDECSDNVIWDNLDDDGAVNVAGQAVFGEFGGSKNEFFLDFAEGDNRRAFPGLVLMDKTNSTKEQIVSYRNLKTGMEKLQQFGEKLKSSACSNQGLALYLVALDVKKDTSAEKKGWLIGASVAGSTMAWLGASWAIATFTTASSSILVGSGIAAMSVPVVGWVIGGVLVATATVISLVPSKIEDIQQVMILDGPYML